MTKEGDLVLTHIKNKPAFFARIEEIGPDLKPNWFQVRMLVLQVPLVTITWILREAYINGEEFTMGGHPVKLVKVVAPEANGEQMESASTEPHEFPSLDPEPPPAEEPLTAAPPKPAEGEPARAGKVVSLLDRRKKNSD